MNVSFNDVTSTAAKVITAAEIVDPDTGEIIST
jgi:hypothetical protein